MKVFLDWDSSFIPAFNKLSQADPLVGSWVDYAFYYEFFKRIGDAEIEFYVDGDKILPVRTLKTPSEGGGPIPTILGDGDFPFQDEFYKDEQFIKECGFEVIPCAREDAVVKTSYSGFAEHLKHLSQVGRAYKHSKGLRFSLNMGMSPVEYFTNYHHCRRHFTESKGSSVDTLATYQHFLTLAEHGMFTINIYEGSSLLATGFFVKREGEVYWLNTFRDHTDTRAIGNLVLLEALRICYDTKDTNLNLGYGWMSYKFSAWKAVSVPVKGLRRLEKT
jgi:hypothetical protein